MLKNEEIEKFKLDKLYEISEIGVGGIVGVRVVMSCVVFVRCLGMCGHSKYFYVSYA